MADEWACETGHTPQMRCTICAASSGVRFSTTISMPRKQPPDTQASDTLPLVTSISTRRWPSMRVIGSITERVM